MNTTVELIGAVQDTEGRTLTVYADSGAVRIDYPGDQRGLFWRVAASDLVDLLIEAGSAALLQEAESDA